MIIKLFFLTLSALAQVGVTNNANSISSNSANAAPAKASLVTLKKLIITSGSTRKYCGYLAGDPKKQNVCFPDDATLTKARGLSDRVLASEAATCAHDRGSDWRCWGPITSSYAKAPDLGLLNGAAGLDLFSYAQNICRKSSDGFISCITNAAWSEGGFEITSGNSVKYGPFKNLKAASADDQKLCVIDGDEVKCALRKYTTLPTLPKFVNPRLISVGDFGICVADDTGVNCLPMSQSRTSAPLKHPAWASAIAIRATSRGVCSVLGDGTVECDEPVAGYANQLNAKIAMPKGLANVVQLETSGDSSCVRILDGSVKCWGPMTRDYGIPPSVVKATDISVADHHACAAVESGEVICWGSNSHGQLNQSLRPGTPVQSAAGGGIECRWNNTGAVCTGDAFSSAKADLSTLLSPLQIAVSNTPSYDGALCAIDRVANASSKVICFGSNAELVAVPQTLKNPTMLVTSGPDACAVSADSSVQCWGKTNLGVAPNTPRNIRRLSMSSSLACVVDDFGLMCWGPGAQGDMQVPPELARDGVVADVAIGSTAACALTVEKNVECWGAGAPKVPDLNHPVAIYGYGKTFCATDDDGVKCFGDVAGTLPAAGTGSSVNSNRVQYQGGASGQF